MRQLLVVGYQVRHINVAVILLHQDIFPYLISAAPRIRKYYLVGRMCLPVYKSIVESELKDKVP